MTKEQEKKFAKLIQPLVEEIIKKQKLNEGYTFQSPEYWKGYAIDTSHESNKSDAKEIHNFEAVYPLVRNSIKKYGGADDEKKFYIYAEVTNAFMKIGWVNQNIIDAIVMQG